MIDREMYATIISCKVSTMTRQAKLIKKLQDPKAAWSWDELCALLRGLGYHKLEGSGSRVKFDNGSSGNLINLHRPHPGNQVKAYVIRRIREKLQSGGKL